MTSKYQPIRHHDRSSYSAACPVCGAAAFDLCLKMDTGEDQHDPVEWIEYKLLSATHELKEVAPDHYLVRVIEEALTTPVSPDQLALFPSRQKGR